MVSVLGAMLCAHTCVVDENVYGACLFGDLCHACRDAGLGADIQADCADAILCQLL